MVGSHRGNAQRAAVEFIGPPALHTPCHHPQPQACSSAIHPTQTDSDADPYGELGAMLDTHYRDWDAAIIIPHQGALKRLKRQPSKRLRLRQGGHGWNGFLGRTKRKQWR